MRSFSPRLAGFFAHLARRIVPETAEMDTEQQQLFWRAVDNMLAARPKLTAQFKLFLNVLRWSPLLRYGRRLDRLPGEKQDRILTWFQNAPFLLLRRGFWGLKTMIFVGYYGGAGIEDKIHFTPSRTGNEMLHD